MAVAIVGLYGLFAFVALLNLILMRRPRPLATDEPLAILIPARNEAENLKVLLPALLPPTQSGPRSKIYVFDDESEDGTGEIAAGLGATVVRPREPLPEGWTGKNRAMHELAKVATEDSEARWWVFLDADTRPEPEFLNFLRGLIKQVGWKSPVITGFPKVIPGRGVEPLFLAWVGWILLATNPYGLVGRTGKGHNRFLNGQVQVWRSDVYTQLWPNERMKGRIMEDVMVGRLLAREGIRVETANFSHVLSVRMYETWRQTLDGMSKNSFEITGTTWGSVLITIFFLVVAWAWLAAGALMWLALGLFALSGLLVALIARAPFWPLLLMPLACTIAAVTQLRSLWWRKTGRTNWKGRVYSNNS